ncbi:MAG: sugar phosphate isomerase/epimerase [Bacteroidetes bacterium]|nr:sugar phosphate isomerase/epimerase [Bacteroidota bacterium]
MKNLPKIHNATWPGLVGKGPDSEPVISLDDLLRLTASAEVNGIKFDGIDVGLLEPHIFLDRPDEAKKFAEKVSGYGLKVGSLVAPIWAGSAMGTADQRKTFVEMVRKACLFGQQLRQLGVRDYGIVRIDSAAGVADWAKDPLGNSKLISQTFQEAADVAADFGEKLAAEGEICWGGMHSWKHMLELLEMTDRSNVGFQADMSHTFLYTLGYNAPEHRILPADAKLSDREAIKAALKTLSAALRPWTIDFHVAQNDGSVFGSGSHDKTGRHCQATDPNGVLDIAQDAGYWLRDEKGNPTQAMRHICWDGCMFPNAVMERQQTWNEVLAALIQVREAHGTGLA